MSERPPGSDGDARPTLDLARLLRPTRASRTSVEALVRPGDDAAACWEALAAQGAIPPEWVTDDRRDFVAWCAACRGFGFSMKAAPARCAVCEGQCVLARATPEPALGLALAADVTGVLAAEALAMEFIARLRRCGVTHASDRPRWRAGGDAADVALRQWTVLGRSPYAPFAGFARQPFAAAAAGDLRAAASWKGEVDVFDPLLRLYARGYALDTVTGSGVVLIAPEF